MPTRHGNYVVAHVFGLVVEALNAGTVYLDDPAVTRELLRLNSQSWGSWVKWTPRRL
jgi:hypothetical protein